MKSQTISITRNIQTCVIHHREARPYEKFGDELRGVACKLMFDNI